jgi:hypothetical protein
MKKIALALISLSMANPLLSNDKKMFFPADGGNDPLAQLAILAVGLACTGVAVKLLEDAPLTPTRHDATSVVAGAGVAASAYGALHQTTGATPLALAAGVTVGLVYQTFRPEQRRAKNDRDVENLKKDPLLPTLHSAYTESEAVVVKKITQETVQEDYSLLTACKNISGYLTKTQAARKELERLDYYPFVSHNFQANKVFLQEAKEVTTDVLNTAKNSKLYVTQTKLKNEQEELRLKQERNDAERRKADAQEKQANTDRARFVRQVWNDLTGPFSRGNHADF